MPLRGHKILWVDETTGWVYADTREPTVTNWDSRPCGFCGKHSTDEGYDSCLGTLPYVMNACCGHGESDLAYVQFENQVCLRGEAAIVFFDKTRKDAAMQRDEQYGVLTVERYIREGLPEGFEAFFDLNGVAAKLAYIRARSGSMTLHGLHPVSQSRAEIKGGLDTPLYLAQETIEGLDIETVSANARVAPTGDHGHAAGLLSPSCPRTCPGSLAPAGQFHG